MDRATPSTGSANVLYCALELSKKSWLLAIQFPDQEQPSLYPIEGGDAERLMAKLTAARERWVKAPTPWVSATSVQPCFTRDVQQASAASRVLPKTHINCSKTHLVPNR